MNRTLAAAMRVQRRRLVAASSQGQGIARAWATAAKATGLKPVMAVADLVLNHLEQIINFARNPVTNAGAEGINGVVMTLQRAARGCRTWSTFRTAILFVCGGLDLYPIPRVGTCPSSSRRAAGRAE